MIRTSRDGCVWAALAMALATAGLPPARVAAARDDASTGAAARSAEADPESLRRYLEAFALDREARELLDRPGPWDDDRLAVAVRTLARLSLAPPALADGWRRDAIAVEEIGTPPADRLVRVAGRAHFVAPLRPPVPLALPPEAPDREPRSDVDVVRMVTESGTTIDLLTPSAPRAWPRWRAIDEPASAWGLPLAAGGGPRPAGGAGEDWPDAAPARVLAAPRVAWRAPGLAGAAGMDAGLFDRVADGRRLTADDADAFFALLATAGAAGEGSIAAAAGPPRSIIPLIDPAERWFEKHRGEPVAIQGTALRATRIEIDDPVRRRQTGLDHYWEVFVFVPTPPIEVAGRIQDRYPVVCCLRGLPAGMPAGPSIGEQVRVAGFAFKSYAYPLPRGDGPAERREAPLLVGGDVEWLRPAPAAGGGPLGAVLAGLAALVGVGVAFAAWRGSRDARHRDRLRRGGLPGQVVLPGGGAADD